MHISTTDSPVLTGDSFTIQAGVRICFQPTTGTLNYMKLCCPSQAKDRPGQLFDHVFSLSAPATPEDISERLRAVAHQKGLDIQKVRKKETHPINETTTNGITSYWWDVVRKPFR